MAFWRFSPKYYKKKGQKKSAEKTPILLFNDDLEVTLLTSSEGPVLKVVARTLLHWQFSLC